MVEAGGVGILMGVENTQVIDFARRQKRRKLSNRVELERIWNAGFPPAGRSCEEGLTSPISALDVQVTLDRCRPNFPEPRFGGAIAPSGAMMILSTCPGCRLTVK